MRRLLVCSALLASATSAVAQAPTTPAPAAAAPAPKVGGGPSRAEFRIGGFMVSGERSYDYANAVNTATGQIRGVEVLLRARAIGLYVRSLSGTFGTKGSTTNALQPQVISLDARLLLFPPTFTIFGGVGKRMLSSSLRNLVYDVAMGGISSTVNIGGTGLRTHISGALLVSPNKSTTTGVGAVQKPSTGLEGEAAIFYRLPRVPLFVTVGYRTEVFTGKAGSVDSPEEVRGVRIGGGIQFGGH